MPITKANGKKDGLQRYRVRVNYTDSEGNHRQREKAAYGLAEAKELERQMMLEASASPARKMTVDELCKLYLRAKKGDLRASSLSRIENKTRIHICPYLGAYRVDKLPPSLIEKWKIYINGKGLRVATKKAIFRQLSAICNWAARQGYMKDNPLRLVDNFSDSEAAPKSDLQYYTADDFLKFIEKAEAAAHDVRTWGLYVFFNIAFYTGMRKGEINALKWSDIDGNIIHVRRSINQKNGKRDIETMPKNRPSIRDVQMPSALIKVLSAHKERQKADPCFTEDYRACGGAVCLRDTSIDVANRKYAEAAGLPRIRIHDFRHSHASVLCNEGINIQEIARRLGHSDIQTTWQIYAHLYPREEERAIAILEKIGENSGQTPKKPHN